MVPNGTEGARAPVRSEKSQSDGPPFVRGRRLFLVGLALSSVARAGGADGPTGRAAQPAVHV